MFADDTNLTLSAKTLTELKLALTPELNNLSCWLKANKLSLNVAKTELMIIGSRQRLSAQCDDVEIRIDDQIIKRVDHTKSLGLTIDAQLSWGKHVEEICKKVSSAIGALNENNVDDMWNGWKGLFMQAVQNNISSKKIKPRRNVPWITSEIRKLFRKRKRLRRKAKATQLPSDWNKYKQLRNETKSALNKSYWSHVHDLIDSKNPKRFWSFIKTKTKSKSIPPVVKFQNERASTASDKAELFNNFFCLSIFI